MQAAMVWTLMNATGYPPNTGDDPPNHGARRRDPPAQVFPGLNLPRQYRCKDGWIVYTISLASIGARTHAAVMELAESLGVLPNHLHGVDWANWPAAVQEGSLTVEDMKDSLEVAAAIFESRTKIELQEFATRAEIILSPIYTVEDLAIDPHLEARDFWVTAGGRRHPGPFAKLSATPIRMESPAPSLGEHQELLDSVPTRTPSAIVTSGGTRPRSFEGLKVADFAWVGVGPIISKGLADHGATVVHVESANQARRAAPRSTVQGWRRRHRPGAVHGELQFVEARARLRSEDARGTRTRAAADRLGGCRGRELHARHDGAIRDRLRLHREAASQTSS